MALEKCHFCPVIFSLGQIFVELGLDEGGGLWLAPCQLDLLKKKSPSSVEREPWNSLNCWALVSHSHLFPWKPHPQQPDNSSRSLAGDQIAAYSLQWANDPPSGPLFCASPPSFTHLPFLVPTCFWKALVKAFWKNNSALMNWISWQSNQSLAQCFSEPLKSLRWDRRHSYCSQQVCYGLYCLCSFGFKTVFSPHVMFRLLG